MQETAYTGEGTQGIRLNLCWGAAKIWQEIYGFFIGNCLFSCYTPINCIREETEQRVFCLLDTDKDSTQPSLGGGEERGLIPRKHTSPCRKPQLGWRNTGRKKTSLQQQSEMKTSFTSMLTTFDFFLHQRGFCSLLLTKPGSQILCIYRAQGGEKGQVGQDLSDSCLPWEALSPVETGLTRMAVSPVSNQASRTLLPPAWTWSELAWNTLYVLAWTQLQPLGKAACSCSHRGLAEPLV